MSFRSEQVPGKVEQHLYACLQCGASNGKNAEQCWQCESRLPPPLFDELRDPAPPAGATEQKSVQAVARPAETPLWRSEKFSANSSPETVEELPHPLDFFADSASRDASVEHADMRPGDQGMESGRMALFGEGSSRAEHSGMQAATPLKYGDPTERFHVAANGPSMQLETMGHPQAGLDRFRGDALGSLTTTTRTPAMGRFALTAALATLVGAAFIGQRIYGSRTPIDHSQGASRDAATKLREPVLSGLSETGSPVETAAGIAPSDAVAANAALPETASAKAPPRTKIDPGFSRGLSTAISASSPTTLPVAAASRSSPPAPVLQTSSAPLDTRASDSTSTASDMAATSPVGMTPADIVVPPPVAARPALLEASGAVGGDRRRRGEASPTPARATVCSEAIQALGLCSPASSPPKE